MHLPRSSGKRQPHLHPPPRPNGRHRHHHLCGLGIDLFCFACCVFLFSVSHARSSTVIPTTPRRHDRRDKATSNICTAQALLANMAASYGVYHGPEGVKDIAERIHGMAAVTAEALKGAGFGLSSHQFFDTFSGERRREERNGPVWGTAWLGLAWLDFPCRVQIHFTIFSRPVFRPTAKELPSLVIYLSLAFPAGQSSCCSFVDPCVPVLQFYRMKAHCFTPPPPLFPCSPVYSGIWALISTCFDLLFSGPIQPDNGFGYPSRCFTPLVDETQEVVLL